MPVQRVRCGGRRWPKPLDLANYLSQPRAGFSSSAEVRLSSSCSAASVSFKESDLIEHLTSILRKSRDYSILPTDRERRWLAKFVAHYGAAFRPDTREMRQPTQQLLDRDARFRLREIESTQLCGPVAKPRWRRRLGRSMSKRSGSGNTVGSRLAADHAIDGRAGFKTHSCELAISYHVASCGLHGAQPRMVSSRT